MTIPQTIDDIALITQVGAQDQAAMSVLYDRYARVMYSLSFRMLGSVEEAEEVVLDVFAQVWRTACNYDAKKGRVDSWLFMQTRSRTLDLLRKRKRQMKAVDASKSVAQVHPASAMPEQHALIQERRELVQGALAQIPVEQRQVLELAYFQGLSQSEIAKQTGCSLGTVKTRTRLGLSKLRGILDPA